MTLYVCFEAALAGAEKAGDLRGDGLRNFVGRLLAVAAAARGNVLVCVTNNP
jgi:hypothetical protein